MSDIDDEEFFEEDETVECELCGDPIEPEWVGETHEHYASWRGPLCLEFVKSSSHRGVAFLVRHHSVEREEVIAVMIGDDREHRISADDVTVIRREAFCGECGQLGARCDFLDRDDYDKEMEEEEDE